MTQVVKYKDINSVRDDEIVQNRDVVSMDSHRISYSALGHCLPSMRGQFSCQTQG